MGVKVTGKYWVSHQESDCYEFIGFAIHDSVQSIVGIETLWNIVSGDIEVKTIGGCWVSHQDGDFYELIGFAIHDSVQSYH